MEVNCQVPAKGEIVKADVGNFPKMTYRVNEVVWVYGPDFTDITLILIRVHESQSRSQDGLPGATAEDVT